MAARESRIYPEKYYGYDLYRPGDKERSRGSGGGGSSWASSWLNPFRTKETHDRDNEYYGRAYDTYIGGGSDRYGGGGGDRKGGGGTDIYGDRYGGERRGSDNYGERYPDKYGERRDSDIYGDRYPDRYGERNGKKLGRTGLSPYRKNYPEDYEGQKEGIWPSTRHGAADDYDRQRISQTQRRDKYDEFDRQGREKRSSSSGYLPTRKYQGEYDHESDQDRWRDRERRREGPGDAYDRNMYGGRSGDHYDRYISGGGEGARRGDYDRPYYTDKHQREGVTGRKPVCEFCGPCEHVLGKTTYSCGKGSDSGYRPQQSDTGGRGYPMKSGFGDWDTLYQRQRERENEGLGDYSERNRQKDRTAARGRHEGFDHDDHKEHHGTSKLSPEEVEEARERGRRRAVEEREGKSSAHGGSWDKMMGGVESGMGKAFRRPGLVLRGEERKGHGDHDDEHDNYDDERYGPRSVTRDRDRDRGFDEYYDGRRGKANGYSGRSSSGMQPAYGSRSGRDIDRYGEAGRTTGSAPAAANVANGGRRFRNDDARDEHDFDKGKKDKYDDRKYESGRSGDYDRDHDTGERTSWRQKIFPSRSRPHSDQDGQDSLSYDQQGSNAMKRSNTWERKQDY